MNNNLVIIKEGQVVVSSRQVAEHFEKEHRNVLASVKEIADQISTADFSALFSEATYIALNGKSNPEYLMNKKGFSLLAMGFTGSKALRWKLKYIEAFEEMEKQLNFTMPKTFAEALQLAADQARQLEAAKPALEFVERYTKADGLFKLRDVAKIVGIPERTFSRLLRESKVIFGKSWQPTSKYVTEGYFEVKVGEGNGFSYSHPYFTPAGVEWITRAANRKGWVKAEGV